MQELILQYSTFINTASGGNEMLASAISVMAFTAFVYLIRGLPRVIFDTFKTHAITTFTINNSTYNNELAVARLQSWLSGKISTKGSRTLSFNPSHFHTTGDQHMFVGIGYGFHWFIHNKRLFWVFKNKLESSGSENQKEEYTFRTFGRSHKPFYDFVELFAEEPEQEGLKVWTMNKDSWDVKCRIPERSLSTVAMSNTKKNEIIDNINNFKNNKEWFRKASLPYKLSYILHGKPASGKTSLIKTIASEFGMNLCLLNLQYVTDGNLPDIIANMPKNSILAIEDFDSSNATKDRRIDADGIKGNSGDDIASLIDGLTLSGLLNALDGIIPIDDAIVFLTTNDLKSVDPALYRKGRIDYMMEMNELESEDIMDFSKRMFPDYDFSNYMFVRSMGCNLNEALLYCRGDVERYNESLINNGIMKEKYINRCAVSNNSIIMNE